jgi:hypothetical protein
VVPFSAKFDRFFIPSNLNFLFTKYSFTYLVLMMSLHFPPCP